MKFQISSRRETGKEIPESSRFEFLEKFLANNFALSDAENSKSFDTLLQIVKGHTKLYNVTMFFLIYFVYLSHCILSWLLKFSSSIPYLHLFFLKFICNLLGHVWTQWGEAQPLPGFLSAFYFPVHEKCRISFLLDQCHHRLRQLG